MGDAIQKMCGNQRSRLFARLRGAFASALLLAGLAGCMATTVAVDEQTQFPVPLVGKIPLTVGMHLPEELISFEHSEDHGDDGTFTIDIGDAQPTVFRNLFSGMFEGVQEIGDPSRPQGDVAGTIVPRIMEMQFSTPYQTRTDYFEVWVRYQFELFGRDGARLGDWQLTAYGKANTQNYGLNTTTPTLRAAALQACRDAMAFFTVQFPREGVVQQWLTMELAAQRPMISPVAKPPAPAQASGATQTGEGET